MSEPPIVRSGRHAPCRAGAVPALATILALLATAPGIDAQAVSLIDLAPGPASSTPRGFTVVGSNAYFSASDGTTRRLYRTSGVSSTLVTAAVGDVGGIAALGSRVVFAADDGAGGVEPWVSNGTAAGTFSLGNLRLGNAGSLPQDLTTIGNRVFFTADDSVHGRELYVTDGTAAGTRRVRDIHPGGSSNPRFLTPFDGRVVFTAFDPTHGRELWISDGTSGGTRQIDDVLSGRSGSSPKHLSVYAGQLYFSALDSSGGRRMWRTDGTRFRTVFWSNVEPTSAIHSIPGLGIFTGRTADEGDEVWRLDGELGGNQLVSPLVRGPGSASPFDLVSAGNLVYFTASTPDRGRELYATDGRAHYLSREIRPGPANGIDRNGLDGPLLLSLGRDRVLFPGIGADGDVELWTASNQVLRSYRYVAQDLNPDGGSSPQAFARLGDRVLFAANDGQRGEELYTVLVDGICCGTSEQYVQGCLGTGVRVGSCEGGGQVSRFASNAARVRKGFAIEIRTRSAPLTVRGYELYTHSLGIGAVTMPAAIHRASPVSSRGPSITAAARGNMRLGIDPGFYQVVFDRDVHVPANSRFYITFEGDLARFPETDRGALKTTFDRVRAGGIWTQRDARRVVYRVLCTQSVEPPGITATRPRINESVDVRLAGALGNASTALFVGTSREELNGLPLPFDLGVLGAPGCSLATSANVVVPWTVDALGNAAMTLAIPNLPIVGSRFNLQAAIVDPGANALGVVMTNAMHLIVGIR